MLFCSADLENFNGKSYTKFVKHSFSKKNPNRKTKVNCSPREINEIDSVFFLTSTICYQEPGKIKYLGIPSDFN